MIRQAARKNTPRGTATMGAVPAWVESALQRAAGQVGLTVVLDTNISKPSILYQAGKPPAETSRGAHLVGMFLKPTVYIASTTGRQVIAPYGQANHNFGPALAVGAAIIGALALWGGADIARRIG